MSMHYTLKKSVILARISLGIFVFSAAHAVGTPVSFREQIAPILLQQCQSCHGPTEQKGGYRLDTFDFLSRKDDTGDPPLVPGQPEKSDLYSLLVTAEADERMPKKAAPLPKETIDLVRRWIAEGAQFDGGDKTAALVEIIPPRVHDKAPEVYSLPLPVTALAFSPDGSELVASGFRELTVWKPDEGKLLRRIANVAPRTFEIAYTPDGGALAVASGSPGEFGEVRLYEPKTGAMLRQIISAADAVLDVKISADGRWLVTGGADHCLSIFDFATGERRHRLSVHSDAVTAVAISPDSTQVASVALDRAAKVFDIKSGKLVSTYRDHQSPLYGIAFTHDGKQVMTAGYDKSLHQWSIADAKKQRDLVLEGNVLRMQVLGDQIYFGGSGKKISQASIVDLKAGRVLSAVGDWVYALAIHAPTHRLAVGGYDGKITVWNMEDGKQVAQFSAAPGYTESVVATSAP